MCERKKGKLLKIAAVEGGKPQYTDIDMWQERKQCCQQQEKIIEIKCPTWRLKASAVHYPLRKTVKTGK